MKKGLLILVLLTTTLLIHAESQIVPVGIFLENTIPVVRKSNPVNVEFFNQGDSRMVSVELFAGDTDLENKIGEQLLDCSAKVTCIASFPWSPSKQQEYKLIARIDGNILLDCNVSADIMLDRDDLPQIGGSEIFGEEFLKTLPPYKKPEPRENEFQLDTLSVEEVGSEKKFWGTDPRTNKLYEYNTTLVARGRNCKIYLEENRDVNQDAIKKLMREFDSKIYPKITGYFGKDPQPGIDNDPRLTIVLLDIPDDYEKTGSFVGGYFSPLNLYPQSALDEHNQQTGNNLHSNETEMVAMDIHPGNINDASKFGGTLAHEFQHLIHFTHDQQSATWFNEACSQYASYLYNHQHPGQNLSFLKGNSDVPLIFWSQNVASYGAVYLFVYYLVQEYFPDAAERQEFFQSMVNAQGKKTKAVQYIMDALAKKRPDLNFQTLFAEWSAAILVNDDQAKYYGYKDELIVPQLKQFQGKEYHRLPLPFHQGDVQFFGLDYITVSQDFEQGEYLNFLPENPNYQDKVKFISDRPGTLVWGVNNWETPSENLWPENSVLRKSGAVGTPFVKNSETGKYEVSVGDFEDHYVDSLDYVFLYEDNTYEKKHRKIVLLPYDPGTVNISNQFWCFEPKEDDNWIISVVEQYRDSTYKLKHFTQHQGKFRWSLKNLSEKGGKATFIISGYPKKNAQKCEYQFSVGSDLDFLALKSEEKNPEKVEWNTVSQLEERILTSLAKGDSSLVEEIQNRPGVLKNLKNLKSEIQKFITIKLQGRGNSGKWKKFLKNIRN